MSEALSDTEMGALERTMDSLRGRSGAFASALLERLAGMPFSPPHNVGVGADVAPPAKSGPDFAREAVEALARIVGDSTIPASFRIEAASVMLKYAGVVE